MTPGLLLATRFGLGIRDPAWFEHRLELITAVTIPSLLAQSDQNFEWAVLVDSGPPPAVRSVLEERLAPFEGRAFLHTQQLGGGARSLLRLARERDLVDGDGYLLTGRIDDDDAWSSSTVDEVRTRVSSWQRRRGAPGYGLTFENGLVWTMYDLTDAHRPDGESKVHAASLLPLTLPFLSMSCFVLAPLDLELTALSQAHSRIPRLLEAHGLATEAIATEDPMWLYCRHKQTDSSTAKACEPTELKIDLAELAADFGIDECRARSYIESADRYGYVKVDRLWERHSRFWRALAEIDRKFDSPGGGADRATETEREKRAIMAAWTDMAEDVVQRKA